MAGVTTESAWMDLQFIDLPNDFIELVEDEKIIILDKNKLETKVSSHEMEKLDKKEIYQIKYWGSKTYGEIIFNGYD